MRRGQYSLVEQTVLFGAGIVIVLGLLVTFQGVSDQLQDRVLETETGLVAQYVAMNAVTMVASGGEGRMTFPVPEQLATQEYGVRLRDGAVEVVAIGTSASASLRGVEERLQLAGAVESDAGQVTLELGGGRLRLEAAG